MINELSTSTAPSVSPATRSTIRVGVVGLGRSGTFFHCRPIAQRSDFRLAGVFDARGEVAEQIAGEYGCKAFAELPELIASPEIDLVVVAVPTSAHVEVALEVICAGKNVLIEKPFAPSSEEAQLIFEAGKKAGVFVGAFHNRRFDPDVQTLKQILDSGVLGRVLKVSINLHSYTRRKDWQTLRSMGGGALANWGAHALDWCFFLFGKHLRFSHGQLMQVLNPGDAEDSFFLTLEAGDAVIDVEYLNFVARGLPRWHVIGQFGTAISEGKEFQVRYCDPARLSALEADTGAASDGTYGITEDLLWTEKTVGWDYWDNCPLFFDCLSKHLREGAPAPITEMEVLTELRLMETIRNAPFRRFLKENVQRNGTH